MTKLTAAFVTLLGFCNTGNPLNFPGSSFILHNKVNSRNIITFLSILTDCYIGLNFVAIKKLIHTWTKDPVAILKAGVSVKFVHKIFLYHDEHWGHLECVSKSNIISYELFLFPG